MTHRLMLVGFFVFYGSSLKTKMPHKLGDEIWGIFRA